MMRRALSPPTLPQDPAARTGDVCHGNDTGIRNSDSDNVVGDQSCSVGASPSDRIAHETETGSGLCDEQGTAYSDNQIRAYAKKTLKDAGINENRPYHIKHVTVSFLYGFHMPPEKIALFLRQKVDSFTFFKHYVSNDLGRQCAGSIVAEFVKACPFCNCILFVLATVCVSAVDNAYNNPCPFKVSIFKTMVWPAFPTGLGHNQPHILVVSLSIREGRPHRLPARALPRRVQDSTDC
jgi:hypothetical protein